MRKPHDFLMLILALLLRPSTTPLEAASEHRHAAFGRLFISMTVAAPNGLRRACMLWSVCFAVAPGNFFESHNAAAGTVDPPHGVQKEDEKPPQGNELKASFGELVVTGRR